MDPARFTQVDATMWRIESRGAMRVPAIIYADEDLILRMDDKVFEQAVNVATLPGIVAASLDRWMDSLTALPVQPFHGKTIGTARHGQGEERGY